MSAGNVGILLAINYIQDNVNWGLGFGIPCIIMGGALVIFLLGTKTYRYSIKREEEHAFLRIGQVFVTAIRNWKITTPATAFEEEALEAPPHKISEQFK